MTMNIANEPASRTLPYPSEIRPYVWQGGAIGKECDIGPYLVAVRWDWLGAEPKKDGATYAMLLISRFDGGSVVDWRDMQQIKNIVLGDEWEGVEIFPAESRLKDPSNARFLWCCNRALPFGLPGGRAVCDAHEAVAPQRPLARVPA